MKPREEPLDPAVVQLLQQVEWDAEGYLEDIVAPAWEEGLGLGPRPDDNPFWEVVADEARSGDKALRLLFSHYVFGHRRFLRFGAAEAARKAVDEVIRDVHAFLRKGESEPFWNAFVSHLAPRATKSLDQLKALVEGVLQLAFDVYRHSGEESLLSWIVEEIQETGRLEHVYELLREIPGFGPKSLSRLLRDLVVIYGLEGRVHPVDRYLLTAVGKPIRALAPQIVPESRERKLPDWILAGKVSKACRLAGVSAARFNMGAEYRFLEAGGEEEA